MKIAFRWRTLALHASIVGALAVFVILPSFAQTNVVKEGRLTIEFLGLHKWTVQQLQDSVKKYNPNGKLAFCMAALKSNLGFADASVMGYKDTVVITVVEPDDSALVKRNTNFPSNITLPQDWNKFQQQFAFKSMERSFAIFTRWWSDDSARVALQSYNKEVPISAALDTTVFWNIRTAVKNNTIPATLLSKIVYSSWDPYARETAVVAMSGLPDNDTCFSSIIHTLLDVAADSPVLRFNEYITLIIDRRSLPINLAPMYADLRTLVNGANLPVYFTILGVIAKGKPTEKDFREIFATEQSRRLLFSHLQATTSIMRKNAQELITSVNPKFSSLSESEQKKYLNIR
ncbi:MAG: hypothetical protein MUF71_18420 [Candidatus Kapabacteria bacterium]|jgi:hypothetical protein|nr:hypothetical protein [Candidatus Kapabacteria bacterium]